MAYKLEWLGMAFEFVYSIHPISATLFRTSPDHGLILSLSVDLGPEWL